MERIGLLMTTNNHVAVRSICTFFCVLALSGCSGQNYKIAPVSGRVTLDGRPLANAHVSFQPMAAGTPPPGPGSFGVTDAEGRFRLQVIEPRCGGAVVGQHVVRIMLRQQDTATDDAAPRRDASLPSQADDGSLRFQVPHSGTDKADFNLTMKGT
jgi:hypothetical protein